MSPMGRICSICHHPRRSEIDAAIVTGEQGYRHIASRFGLNYKAVERHKAEHIAASMTQAKEAEAVSNADDLVEQLRTLQQRTLAILDGAERDGERGIALAAIDKARRNLEFMAKLLGQLDERPQQQINVLLHPDWLAVRGVLIGALAPHPAARRDVAAALVRIEGSSGVLGGGAGGGNGNGNVEYRH